MSHFTAERGISNLAELFSVSSPTVYRTLDRAKIAWRRIWNSTAVDPLMAPHRSSQCWNPRSGYQQCATRACDHLWRGRTETSSLLRPQSLSPEKRTSCHFQLGSHFAALWVSLVVTFGNPVAQPCQSAFNGDPLSASEYDPPPGGWDRRGRVRDPLLLSEVETTAQPDLFYADHPRLPFHRCTTKRSFCNQTRWVKLDADFPPSGSSLQAFPHPALKFDDFKLR